MPTGGRRFSRAWWWGKYNPAALDKKGLQEAWNKQIVITNAKELKAAEKAFRTLKSQSDKMPEGPAKRECLIEMRALELSLSAQEANAVRNIETLTKLIELRKQNNQPFQDLNKRLWQHQATLSAYQPVPPVLAPPILKNYECAEELKKV